MISGVKTRTAVLAAWVLTITYSCGQSPLSAKTLSLKPESIEALDGNIYQGEWGRVEVRDIGDDHRKGFSSDKSMLVIFGSQDARTPPRNAHVLKPFYKNARFMEVKYGSHDLYQEAFEMLAPYLTGYLSTDDPSTFEVPEEMEVPLNLTPD